MDMTSRADDEEVSLGSGGYLLAIALGVMYLALVDLSSGYTLTWGDPEWWYGLWGRTSAAAMAWMQGLHTIGAFLAALPIGAIIAWRRKDDWFPLAAIVGIVASFGMLLDHLRGIWLLGDLDLQPGLYYVLSMAIDTVKVGFIVLLATALLRWMMQLRKRESAMGST